MRRWSTPVFSDNQAGHGNSGPARKARSWGSACQHPELTLASGAQRLGWRHLSTPKINEQDCIAVEATWDAPAPSNANGVQGLKGMTCCLKPGAMGGRGEYQRLRGTTNHR